MNRFFTSLAAAAVLLAGAALPASAQIDSSFATNGVYTGFTGTGTHAITGAVRLSNGKIVTCGLQNYESIPVLQRFDSLGQPDLTFGTNGVAILSVDFMGNWHGIAQQTDGKLVVVGNQRSGETDPSRFMVARYTSNGVLDSTFGTNGVFFASPTTGDHTAICAAIQADGKIVVGGLAKTIISLGSIPRAVVFRLTSAGAFDTDFNTTGYKFMEDTTNIWNSAIRDIELANGKIYLGYSPGMGFKIACLEADGSYSPSFNNNGMPLEVNISNAYNDDPNSLLVEADGKITVAGTQGQYGAYVARIKADGTGLDPTFAVKPFSNGFMTTTFGSPEFYDVAATGIHKRADGHYWVSGYADVTTGTLDHAVMLLDPNGTPVPYFGTNGYLTHSVTAGKDRTYGSLAWSDRLLLFGTANGYNDLLRFKRSFIQTSIEMPTFAATLYPNPAREMLYIDANQLLMGELLSLTGAVVARYDGTGVLPLGGIAPGMYILRLRDAQGQTANQRVVVE